MQNTLKNYPGAKSGSGVAKRLVSLMPPHRVYVEAFLGSGAVLQLKKPAELTIGLDSDPSVITAWRTGTPGLTLAAASRGRGEGSCIACRDALSWIQASPPVLHDRATLLYLDPPYLRTGADQA